MTKRLMGVTLTLAALTIAGVSAQRSGQTPAPAAPAASAAPTLVLETAKGNIEIELYTKDAPKSIDHIMTLVHRDFYRGLRFHWVQPGVIQFGDPTTRDLSKQSSWGEGGSGTRVGVAEPSKRPWDAASVGIAYRPGQTPTDADSQMFILLGPNPALSGKYTQIGHVTKGMDVARKIEIADVIKKLYVKGEEPK
jgi:cyclophilin family peptidyl-prolyl cis-trans isomerase